MGVFMKRKLSVTQPLPIVFETTAHPTSAPLTATPRCTGIKKPFKKSIQTPIFKELDLGIPSDFLMSDELVEETTTIFGSIKAAEYEMDEFDYELVDALNKEQPV